MLPKSLSVFKMWLLILVWQLFPCCLAVSEGAVRLVPHHSKIDLVEIYYEQQWLPVYDHNWTLQDATVICSQLGYQTIATQNLTCSPPPTSLVISELICNEGHVSISQCIIEVSNNITSLLRAGVICANSFDVQLFTNNTFSSFDGILTMYTNTGWYPLCGETVDEVEVTVICRELGYENGEMALQWTDEIVNNSFVFFEDNCTGDEFRLKSCIKQNINIIQDCLSTVHVQCFGPPSPPCVVPTSSPPSCDTVTLEWLLSTNSNMSYFYIWYRQYSLTVWNVLESNVTSLIVEGLLPATLYEFKVTSSNYYGNSTFSNSLFLTTQQQRIPPANISSVDQITAESATITWELYFLNCSTLIAFEIILNDSLQHYLYKVSLTDKELVKQDTRSGLTNYTISVTKLSANTLYTAVVRTVGHTLSDDLYSVSSEPWNFTTLTIDVGPTVKQFFLYNTFLINPFISLVFLLIILGLFLLLLAIICSCVIIKLCCSGKRKRRRLPYHITSGDTSGQNIYLTGELSDESYIPMVTSSVQTATRTRNNSATNLWIDLPEMTTTFTSVTDEEHSLTPVPERENNDDNNDDESLDNPYDEIPAGSNFIDDDEEDGNLYDEIPQLSDLEQSNSHENLLKLPPCSLSLSQEQSDVPLGPMIPPPMEFAGLPERRTATVSVPIYSKAKPKHLRRHSLDKSSPDNTKKMSLKSKSQLALNFVDKPKHDTSPTKTVSTPKINTTEEDVPYYSIPPYSSKQITTTSSKESLDEERPSSPEYETLVHPKSVDPPASPTTSEVAMTTKSPPLVSPRPLSKKPSSNVAKEN